MRLLFLAFLLGLISCSSSRSSLDDGYSCDYLDAVLNEPKITEFIQSFEGNYSIRIFDLSSLCISSRCGFGRYSVRIMDELQADLNTGKFIDLIILSSTDLKEQELWEFDVLFASKRNGYRDVLFRGQILLGLKNREISVVQSDFGTID